MIGEFWVPSVIYSMLMFSVLRLPCTLLLSLETRALRFDEVKMHLFFYSCLCCLLN